MKDTIWLRCSDIIVNKQALNQEKLDDYIDLMSCAIPARFPPIVVRETSDGPVLVDGRHRLAARKYLGYAFVLARVTL